jgi:hypothetical protein
MIATTGTAVANMNVMDCCPSFYVGADAQVRHMPFQKDFGGNVLKKNYPQGNFFAGFKFNDCIGIEAGYEVSKKKSGNRVHAPTDSVFGTSTEPLDPPFLVGISETSHAHSKIQGWNLNLVGFLPVWCEEYHLSLLGSVGLAQLKHKTRNRLTTTETVTIFDAETDEPIGVRNDVFIGNTNYNKRKVVLRLSGGIQHMLTDCFGIRALVNWENTSKLHAQGRSVERRVRVDSIARAKNSFIYGLGVFTVF